MGWSANSQKHSIFDFQVLGEHFLNSWEVENPQKANSKDRSTEGTRQWWNYNSSPNYNIILKNEYAILIKYFVLSIIFHAIDFKNIYVLIIRPFSFHLLCNQKCSLLMIFFSRVSYFKIYFCWYYNLWKEVQDSACLSFQSSYLISKLFAEKNRFDVTIYEFSFIISKWLSACNNLYPL